MRRIARRLASRGGYTLVELIVVMSMFLIVVTALISLFTAGAKAEVDLNRRFQAQQNARLALDRLRRELHCANGVTPGADDDSDGNVASISVSLPSQCPTAQGANRTIVYDTSQISASRFAVRRTMSGATVQIADYITNDDIFRYTAPSPVARGTLHVDLPVNLNPNEGWKQWRLIDDIVLRNTLRE